MDDAICAQLAYDADDEMLTGSMALMLLVNSLMANATGLLIFFLFGLGENLFDPALYLPKRAAPRTRGRSVVVLEQLDTAEAVALGTGYESPQRLKSAFQRARAAHTIERYRLKHLKHTPVKQVSAAKQPGPPKDDNRLTGSYFRGSKPPVTVWT